jgi:hypothetical protein
LNLNGLPAAFKAPNHPRGYYGAVAEAKCNGGDLKIDGLHRAAEPPHLGEQPAVFSGRSRGKGPKTKQR